MQNHRRSCGTRWRRPTCQCFVGRSKVYLGRWIRRLRSDIVGSLTPVRSMPAVSTCHKTSARRPGAS